MIHPTMWIRGGEVLVDADAAGAVAADIWVADERIVAVLPPDYPVPPAWRGPQLRSVEAAGCLAIPGLINAHCHSYAAMLHGTVPGAPLDLFVLEAMARRAPRNARAHHVSATLHALELLKHGITAHVDHFRDGAVPALAAVDAAFGAYRDIGIRAVIAPMYEDRVYLDSLPIARAELRAEVRERWEAMRKPAPAAYFELMDALLHWRGHAGRLDLMLGVDGPQRCSEKLLQDTGEYSQRHGIGLHTHLLEAKTQRMVAPAATGGSLAALLERHALLGPAASLAHFVWCGERDMEIVAASGANVVHNPLSNLHLGSGLQPTARLLGMGIHLALGTDSASCAAPSLLEQARLMALLSRVQGDDESRWIRERAAFRAATVGGARVLGQEDELGRLAPGYRADIALIDTRGCDWRPRGDVFAHLVMYESGANVRHVLVNGALVMHDGRVQNVNQADLLAEAEELVRADTAANAQSIALAAHERPAFAALLSQALRQPLPEERFARLR